MKLSIRHETRYRYRNPVALQPHRLVLSPRSSPDLTILSTSIRCEPEAMLRWSQDVAGNLIATATFGESTTSLLIVSDIDVVDAAVPWPIFEIAPEAHAYPFDYSDADKTDLGALLQPQHPDPESRIKLWAKAFVLGDRTDTLSLLKDVNAGVLSGIAYRARDEEGTQSPVETLDLASGSCRDIAALFIDAVRHLGFGARAVSGYLHDLQAPPDDAGSTHAWAEVYLPSAGWISFDPTHRRVGSAGLVPVAVGRCNAQIMPVSGGFLGTADDFIDMQVAVRIRSS
jgi:transglutaminase-like putative cysteine protease